jgi:serine palmitoyltransferase
VEFFFLTKKIQGAKVVVFPHNNFKALEKIIRSAISVGQPETGKPWRKILIIVEGIYSMEGEICPLKEIVEIKKKYKCFLWVDEAHSIGALGPHGKGICDFSQVNPKDVDILMGTFTKSFGSVGGYVSGSKKLISYLRSQGLSQFYCASASPVCVQQIISSIDILEGKDNSNIGKNKLKQLHENSIYFREKLIEMGFNVIGDEGSPVVCLSIYYPAAIAAFSRECLKRRVG